nr:3-keto-5-aminohexanoate cleavage protein [Halomonas urmiana]
MPLKPDMASSRPAPTPPIQVYENSLQLVGWLADEMLKYDIKPEIEAFDMSHFHQVVHLPTCSASWCYRRRPMAC